MASVNEYRADPPPEAYYASQSSGRSGCFWLTIGGLGCLSIPLLIIAALVFVGITTTGNLIGGLESMFSSSPVASVTSTQTILTNIQPLGQLVSISIQLAKADISVNIRQGTLDSCSFSASYVAQATIEAGIDLTQISTENIDYNPLTDTYTITLPAVQLTGCRIDYIDQYDESLTLCAVDWDAARQLGQYIALTSFRDDALEGGILDRAEQQVRLVIGNFVYSLTGSAVEIIFSQDPGGPFPASCQPDTPGAWTYDDTQHTWTTP